MYVSLKNMLVLILGILLFSVAVLWYLQEKLFAYQGELYNL